MKALSINPESVMDIFMGQKPIEYRTWKTDYRGVLLICASSQKMPGYVSGHAYFVIPLLDIQISDEPAISASGRIGSVYEWVLGKPKAIQPIPVKGKLHLFDVDDALIHNIKDGDLSAYKNEEEADQVREAFIAAYLDPLLFGGAAAAQPGADKPLLRRKASAVIPPIAPEDDICLIDTIDAMLFLSQEPPMAKQYSGTFGTGGSKRKRYQSLKHCVIDWYWSKYGRAIEKKGGGKLKEEDEPGTYGFYMRFLNPCGLLWMAEAFGESPDKLKEAMDAVEAADKDDIDAACDAFRNVIPFARICQLFDNPRGWLIDEDLKWMMAFRKRDGSPRVAKGMKNEFERAIHRQGICLE